MRSKGNSKRSLRKTRGNGASPKTKKSPPKSKRKNTPTKRKNYKLDEKRTEKLLKANMPVAMVAEDQAVSASTIYRFMEKINLKDEYLKQYKNNRPDILADTSALILNKNRMVLESLNKDEVDAMKPQQKGNLARDLTICYGTLHDKEYRERGGKSAGDNSINIVTYYGDGPLPPPKVEGGVIVQYRRAEEITIAGAVQNPTKTIEAITEAVDGAEDTNTGGNEQ